MDGFFAKKVYVDGFDLFQNKLLFINIKKYLGGTGAISKINFFMDTIQLWTSSIIYKSPIFNDFYTNINFEFLKKIQTNYLVQRNANNYCRASILKNDLENII